MAFSTLEIWAEMQAEVDRLAEYPILDNRNIYIQMTLTRQSLADLVENNDGRPPGKAKRKSKTGLL